MAVILVRFADEVPSLLSGNGLEALARQDFWAEVRAHGQRHKVPRDRAFAALSERGGYPMAQANPDVPWPTIADQLNETVIQRAIQHDLRLGSRGMKRDPRLLEEVFRLACRYAGQTPGRGIFLKELREDLDQRGMAAGPPVSAFPGQRHASHAGRTSGTEVETQQGRQQGLPV